MSAITPTTIEIRLKNLIRIAQLATLIGLIGGTLFTYQGISNQNWYNYLVAGSLFLVTVVALLTTRTSRSESSSIWVWYLLSSITLSALAISLVQANASTEVGTALLIIILLVGVQTLPPETIMRGAVLGAVASLLCSMLAFYSPIRQNINNNVDLVVTWSARIAILVFLIMVMLRFRSLSLVNKLLVSFLSVVVLISITFNTVMTATTTNTLTERIGQQLNTAANGRSIIIGDYINAQIDVLKTLALDETIRQSVIAANASQPDLDTIMQMDERWKQAVASGSDDPLIRNRVSNIPANNLRIFQEISPAHIEMFVTDKIGALVTATEVTSDYFQADEEWWQSTYQKKDVYISAPTYDESAKALSLLVAVPIFETRQGNVDLIGILRTTISINSLISVVKNPIGDTGKIYLYFPDQTMLDTNQAEYENINPDSLIAIQNAANRIFLRADFKGRDSILARTEVQAQSPTSSVNKLGWSVIVSQSTSEALSPVTEQLHVSGFFGTIIAGISALLSLVIAQRLAKPIINLTQTADEIARGNLEARVKVGEQDEIGKLGESFNAMTDQLKENLVRLEVRVAERTMELEKSSQQLNKRAKQFEAIAQLARTITSIQDLDTLLPRITQLVSQQFGFYHAGLFLLDESRQYAILSAANSEGGQRMLARKHRLGVGKTGIVGYVTSTGVPRIALDTGKDVVYFDNPDMPETRSEMALPLRVGKTIIGALDVQSTEPNAFSDDDVEVLTILADEISVAIDNAQLFAESKRVLAEAQSSIGEYTLEAWQQMVKKREVVGYELSGSHIRPIEKPVQNQDSSSIVPIKLRNEVVGSISINMPDGKELNPDQLDITQALIQRLGIALENATFLEKSQRSAAKEQVISEITGKIGSSINLRSVLQTAVEELGRNIPGSEILIELNNHQGKSQSFFLGENR